MKFPDAMTTPPVPASSEKSRIPVMFSATGGWVLYSFFWWPEAKKLPAFRKELDAISQGLAPLLRRHIRGQQWKLFFSRGHIFRKRRDKIRWLKKLLSILDGRKP